MGQSIVVIEKPSSVPGVVRFETDRALTGMGHERYVAGEEVWGERPPDELARRLFDRGGVARVHVNGNMVTVDLEKGHGTDGILDLIANLYRFYPDPAPAAEEAPAAEDAPVEDAPAAVEETSGEETRVTADAPDPESDGEQVVEGAADGSD